MTALDQYARLESMGVWRDGPTAQRRDVIVVFGNATLVISDRADTALAHWSLAAVRRLNPGEQPALFGPGTDATETLEIEDDTMVAAIEKVRALIARRRPRSGRLRGGLLLTLFAALGVLAVAWMPGAAVRHTASILPPSLRAELGAGMLTAITRFSGPPCTSDRGDAALAHLSARLLGDGGGRIVVVPDGVRAAQHLPGGLILVGRSLVEDHDSPDVLAGHLLAETLRREARDPAERLLSGVGLMATVRLLATGAIPADRLEDYARALLTAAPEAIDDDALLTRFAAAGVASSPYARALDMTGEQTLRLIEGDPMAAGGARPVLSDADWVSLQGICGD